MCRYRAQICATMLALLSALGLRHGEARRLRLCDLLLDRQALFIAQTKFHKSRYVPFGPKVGAACSAISKCGTRSCSQCGTTIHSL